MAERTITLQHKNSDGRLQIVLRCTERAGRWLARIEMAAQPETPADWPGIGDSGTTQRVWVGESEAEALDTALNWLRTQYKILDRPTRDV